MPGGNWGTPICCSSRKSRVRLPLAAHVHTIFPIQQTQCALSWKIVVSELWSMTAVSLKIGHDQRWRPPYQAGQMVHMHAKHYEHSEDGIRAPRVCAHGSIPLNHSGNVITRIGLQQQHYLRNIVMSIGTTITTMKVIGTLLF